MGVAAALFSSRRYKNLQNEKIFLYLEIVEIDMGVNFGSRRTILDIKTHFLKLTPFYGGKQPNLMTHSLLQREIL